MRIDVEELKNFYRSPLGQVTRRLLAARIRRRWRDLRHGTIIGLGYASPYLGGFRGQAGAIGALMPQEQGALVWPQTGPKMSLLVDESFLPLPDNTVDRLLVVHGLESSESVRRSLREMWRVLAPDGRAILIVPNRSGIWARTERTPFGYGQPYSRSQLESLLLDAMFTPLDWSGALFVPPINQRILLRSAVAVERIGARLAPGISGVIMVEVTKEMVAPVGKTAKARTIGQLQPIAGGSSLRTHRRACAPTR